MYRCDFDELEDGLGEFYTRFDRHKSAMQEIGVMYRDVIRERITRIYGSLENVRDGLGWGR